MKNILSNKIVRKAILFTSCICIGFGIGFNLEKIQIKLEEIKNKKIEVAKKEEEEINKDNEEKEKEKEEELEAVIEEKSKEDIEALESLEKINDKYKVEKARHFILKEVGGSIGKLVYIGDEAPARINGDYYIFGILEDGDISDKSKFYVDKETFKVYEDSVEEQYFGEYRDI